MSEEDKTKEPESITAGTIRKMISDEVGALVSKLKPGEKTEKVEDEGEPTDIRGQVAAALEGLKRREERQQRDKELDALLAKDKEPPKEKAPIERRRVHKIMGWGEPAE